MGIYENIKDLVKIVKDLDNIELYGKLLDLQGQVNNLNQENISKTERIKELEDLLSVSGKMNFQSPFYYLDGDEIPFCPRCWESNKKAIHLLGTPHRSQECPECNNKYILDENGNVRNIRKKR
ncbi:MAG: hypothetical protein QQN41_03930 [Nitrosopumilus sp.]